MSIEATQFQPFSINAGQQFHTVMNSNLTGDANPDQRMNAMLLAASGITKEEFLGQEAVSEKTFTFLGWIQGAAQDLLKKLAPQNGKLPFLSGDLKQALAETQEGQQWKREDGAKRLKKLLGTAFEGAVNPRPTRKEGGNLVKVIKVGDTEITIISPGISGLNEHRNYKISASVNGQELKATVSASKDDQALFHSLVAFDDAYHVDFQRPESLSVEELRDTLQNGIIVNAVLLNREISRADGTPTDTIQLHLKHNDKLQYFTMKYTGHTQNNPYDVACILEMRDGTSRNLDNVNLDVSIANLHEAAEELIRTKLKAFNEEYSISYS